LLARELAVEENLLKPDPEVLAMGGRLLFTDTAYSLSAESGRKSTNTSG
jgi:hypothetical protein